MTGCYYSGFLRNRIGDRGLGLYGSEQGQVAGSCEYGSEHLGFIKCGGCF